MTKKAKMPTHSESLDTRAIMAGQAGMIGGRPLSMSTLRGKGRCFFDSSLGFPIDFRDDATGPKEK